MKRSQGRLVLPTLLLGLFCATAQARPAAQMPEGVHVPAWNELSTQQQTDLAAFSKRWDGMPAWRRVRILERYDRWQAMPENKRETLREGLQNFRRMSPEQRRKMRHSLQTLRALPPERQRELRQQWQTMTPEQRRDWLDAGGPGVVPPPKP